MTAIFFDTETTGLKSPEIIEAAYLVLPSPLDLNPTFSYCERFRPSKPIELGALATHGIMDEDLVECPPSSEFVFPVDCEYLIGHNCDYDWKAAGSPDVKRIDTLALCREFYPNLDTHTQSAMIWHLERARAKELLAGAHSALADVQNGLLVLQHLMTAMMGTVRTWEQLWKVSEEARIPKKAPFGKYAGQPIYAIPRQYVQWAMKQEYFDPYFLKAMKEQCL